MSNSEDPNTAGLKNKPTKDALAVALDAINDRWSLHIVRALAFGASRYTEILRAVGAPRDVLASRLKTLSESGIVRGREGAAGSSAGYELTQKGKDLGQVVLVLKRWGDTYRDEDVPRVDFIHEACGNVFVAEVRCQACGLPFKSGDLGGAHLSETC